MSEALIDRLFSSAVYPLPHVTYIAPPPPCNSLHIPARSTKRAMGSENGRANRRKAVSAAVRWFPQCEFAIHELMDRSESFRDICEELREAELALSTVDDAPAALRETRRAEWQNLVKRLVGEVEAELRERSVLARRRPNRDSTS
jgi:hypothetical protein